MSGGALLGKIDDETKEKLQQLRRNEHDAAMKLGQAFEQALNHYMVKRAATDSLNQELNGIYKEFNIPKGSRVHFMEDGSVVLMTEGDETDGARE